MLKIVNEPESVLLRPGIGPLRIGEYMTVLHGKKVLQLIMLEFLPSLKVKPLKQTMLNY